MGVAGLLQWLRSAFPECFTKTTLHSEDLLIDANFLVHDAVRTSRSQNESQIIRQIEKQLEKLVSNHRPTRSLIVALDGPAPFAKIETQRHRRLKKGKPPSGRSTGLSTNAVTPGTSLMMSLDSMLVAWADRRSRHLGCSPPCTIVDPSASPGEGEVKLLRHLMDGLDSTSCTTPEPRGATVVGGDSDLVLLALASTASRVQVVEHNSRNPTPAFQTDLLRRRLAPSGHEATQRAASDSLVLLCMLGGNDYLKGAGAYHLAPAFAAWEALGSPPLVGRAPTMIHLQTLGSVLRSALSMDSAGTGASVRARTDSTERETACTAGDVMTDAVHEYVRSLLWNLEMYIEARCPDPSFMLPHAFQAPSCATLTRCDHTEEPTAPAAAAPSIPAHVPSRAIRPVPSHPPSRPIRARPSRPAPAACHTIPLPYMARPAASGAGREIR